MQRKDKLTIVINGRGGVGKDTLCDFTARRAEELSVSRGDRLHALREEGGCILARKLSGWPCTGLVPITYVAKVAPETLSDQP